MPKIPVYDASVNPEAPLPGRSPERLFAEPGSFGAGNGLATIGEGLAESADTLYNAEQTQEVSNVRTQMATARGTLTAQFEKAAATAQPGDASFTDKFLQSVDDHVSAIGQNIQTKAGKRAYDQESAALKADFLARGTEFTVQSAGAKAVADWHTTVNQYAGTLFNDPTQAASVFTSIDNAVKDPAGPFANVPASQKAELQLQAKEQLAIAAGRGVAMMNPDLAEKEYKAGSLPGQSFLTEAGNAQMVSYITTEQNAARTKRIQADMDQERQQREAEKAAGAKIFNTAVANPGDPSVIDMIRRAPGTFEQKAGMFNFVRALNERDLEPSAGAASANTMDLFRRMTLPDKDPNKLTSISQIQEAYSNGQIRRSDLDWLGKQFGNVAGPDGANFMQRQNNFFTAIKPQLDHSTMFKSDPGGPESLYQMRWDFDKTVQKYRDDGKDPNDLLDPSKPDYWGSPAKIAAYARTNEDAMATMRQRTGVTGNSATARKPGESPAAYLKRTGGK